MRTVFALLALTATAMAQAAAPPVAPQQIQPVQPQQPTPNPPVAAPFGGLYNVISGSQPAPQPGQQPPLTPFNAATP